MLASVRTNKIYFIITHLVTLLTISISNASHQPAIGAGDAKLKMVVEGWARPPRRCAIYRQSCMFPVPYSASFEVFEFHRTLNNLVIPVLCIEALLIPWFYVIWYSQSQVSDVLTLTGNRNPSGYGVLHSM